MCGNNSTKTYNVCTNVDGSVTYKYGTSNCTCPVGNTTQCETCTTNVTNYCMGGGGTTATTGSTGTGGGN